MPATERQQADAASGRPPPNTAFGPLRQITAGLLSVGYADAGPAGGPAVVLLYGWPYDIHSFAEVTPLLAGWVRVAVIFRVVALSCSALPMRRLIGTPRSLRMSISSRSSQSTGFPVNFCASALKNFIA